MSDIEKNAPDDELELTPETVEDLDTEDDEGEDVKGGDRNWSRPPSC